MTEKQIKQLERIKNRRTLYEVVLLMPDGREFLAFYCVRTYLRLSVAAENRYEELKGKTGFDKFAVYPNTKPSKLETIPVLKFSGRTQRDAIIKGELPFFMEAL